MPRISMKSRRSETRRCTKCGSDGPFALLTPPAKSSDGLKSQCNSCINKRVRENSKVSVEQGGFLWPQNLSRMNITVDEYRLLLIEQDGLCAMCGSPPKEDKRLGIDHDHECCPPYNMVTNRHYSVRSCGNCLRGLLCDSCNQLLGKMEKIGLQKILNYLFGESPYARLLASGQVSKKPPRE